MLTNVCAFQPADMHAECLIRNEIIKCLWFTALNIMLKENAALEEVDSLLENLFKGICHQIT